jgi:hypothetical protein
MKMVFKIPALQKGAFPKIVFQKNPLCKKNLAGITTRTWYDQRISAGVNLRPNLPLGREGI